MRKTTCCVVLTLAIAMATGCREHATPAPAPTAAASAPAHAASQAAPVVQQPVALRKPPAEPMPDVVVVPRKKFAEALRQARQALADGRFDERNVPTDGASSEDAFAAANADLRDALAWYRGVLATDPGNAAATQGVRDVATGLVARAQAALAREDVVAAQRDADRIDLLHADLPDMPSLRAALEKGWHVAGLVERGQRLESSGALIAPRAANAAAAYRQALALAPGSKRAEAGLARVEGVFLAKALAEANAARYTQSESLLAQAAGVRADSPDLRDARAEIQAIRQRHATLVKAQIDAALKAGDPDHAEALLAQLVRATPRSPMVRDVRQAIANARLYGIYMPAQVFSDALASSGRSPDMVVLPVGNLRMGSPEGEAGREAGEGPQRAIAFRHGFAMARTEITVEQFGRFVRAAHYRTDAERMGHSMVYDEAKGKLEARDGVTWREDHAGKPALPQQPVLHVSWNDAQAYAIWLSKETAHLYRLPSEAEFEYALRAGSTTAYPWAGNRPPKGIGNLAGGDPSPSGRHWGDAFAGYDDGYWGPAPVGSFRSNAFGLLDMVGNVAEWTQDCWHDSYRRAPSDASAWVNPGCTKRVVRGASWASSPVQARSAYRTSLDAESGNSRVGFRVVREL